jgi:eukaryotic-like serine/threonine-protein kinase
MQQVGGLPPDEVAEHLLASGQAEPARGLLLQAATQAEQTLAFDQAARASRQLLVLAGAAAVGPRTLELKLKLGQALANAGRGGEAGPVFLEAAALAPTEMQQRRLSRRAAEELLRAGHVEQGWAVMQELLDAVGLRFGSFSIVAHLQLVLELLAIVLHERLSSRATPNALTPRQAERVDLAWALAPLRDLNTGPGIQGPLRSAWMALRGGDDRRFCRAVFGGFGWVSVFGPLKRPVIYLVERAARRASALDDPYLEGLEAYARGALTFNDQRWRECCEPLLWAARLLEQQPGASWEAGEAHVHLLNALFWCGRLAELSGRLRRLLQDARARGDRLLEDYLYRCNPNNLAWLVVDRADVLEQQLDHPLQSLQSNAQVSVNHYYEALTRADLDLYRGQGLRALRHIDRDWIPLARTGLLIPEYVNILLRLARGRAALAAAGEGAVPPSRQRHLLRRARHDARCIARRCGRFGTSLAQQLSGLASLVQGDQDAARTHLRRADALFAAQQMTLHQQVTRFRLGQLLGGDEGQELQDGAVAYLQREGVVRPERIIALFAPVGDDR